MQHSRSSFGDPMTAFMLSQLFSSNIPPNPADSVPIANQQGLTWSTASTQRWPSDDQCSNSVEMPEHSKEETVQHQGIITLPIQKLQQMTQLEHAISSMQQYECLLGHLKVLNIRFKGNHSDSFRNFITDSVLNRVGFARLKSGKYDYAMQTHFPRIMSAIKCAWFPDVDRNVYETHVELLFKNAHSRFKNKSACTSQRTPLQENQNGTMVQSQQSAPNHRQLMDQWYQSALYYRDRYQIAKKENQKLRANYEVSRRRVLRCLQKMHRLQHHMDLLEQTVGETDG